MAKFQNPEEAAVVEAVSKTEQFFQKNGKKAVIALTVIVLLVVGGYLYKNLVIDSNAEKAAAMIVDAQDRFAGENPDFALALNGDENGAGFLEVVEQYSSTASGNIAKHYVGDLENAEKYLSMYSAVKGLASEVINAQNLGLRGDIAVEKGEYEAAVNLYGKAVKASNNNYTAPLYTFKQILVYATLGNKAAAEKALETLKAEYPSAPETSEAEKIVASL